MATVRLYLLTEQTIVSLEKNIQFERIPCIGEWFRFEKSALLPHQITEVTHNENGKANVVIGPQYIEGKISFHDSYEEMKEDISDLLECGWELKSEKENRVYE